ncbi:MAG TPA: non-homologous end-joining DNA ligase [Candidatus Saccharimonadales bacterium]|nr:non-homologous end-joining DNA ligase [Candidatus Saccharimonadales bacterium]
MRQVSELEVGGERLQVSNLDKVLYPKAGFTKAQVIDYYAKISPMLLPHLKNHPLTLKRYPEGVEGPFFYEKQCPSYRPKWMKTAPVESTKDQRTINYCMANDLRSLVWAANLADLELHTSLALYPKILSPASIVFDLDPGLPANIVQCAQVALWLKAKLDTMKLACFAKTSGSKGLQVYIPLNTPTSYDITKPFAQNMAAFLEKEHPELIVSKMAKNLRDGKVFVDWSQNDQHKTTVCVYSLRAKEQPTVSTPVTWAEVEMVLKKKDARLASFTSDQVLERVKEKGDLFEPVRTLKQRVKSSVIAP